MASIALKRPERNRDRSTVRPDGVVVATPFLDQDLGFAQGVEELAVEEFIAESGIEAFTVAILPG
jgi:hypothetical protein